MNQLSQEDWLDRQLREAVPYLDDAGFTARVMRQLPPPRRRHQLARAAILLVTTIAASALAFVLSGSGRFITAGVEWMATLPILWVLAAAVVSGVLVTAIGLAAAISKTHELQSY